MDERHIKATPTSVVLRSNIRVKRQKEVSGYARHEKIIFFGF